MPDHDTTVATLKTWMDEFAKPRGWEPFHTPKNLVMALAVEVAELMEPFLWLEATDAQRLVHEPQQREAIADEIADVAGLLLHLCRHTGIDLTTALKAKLIKSARKYPVEGSPEV